MKIPESIKTLGSELTSAVTSVSVSAAVTYLSRSVQVVAPHFANSLIEGGAFGLIVNRVALVVGNSLPKSFGFASKLAITSVTAGAVAYGASHLAVRAGLSAAAISPVAAVALTVVTIAATLFAPEDKTVVNAIKTPFVAVKNWVTAPKAEKKAPAPAPTTTPTTANVV